MIDDLTLHAVRAAAERIRGRVVRTPLLVRRLGAAELIFKPECLQPTGAFKIRGVFSLKTTLPPGVQGVVAHPSGNHAQAVARAARELWIRAVAVMPENAPALKLARTVADGVVLSGGDVDPEAPSRTLSGAGPREPVDSWR